MSLSNDTLPPEVFDQRAFAETLEQGPLVPAAKAAIARVNEALHARFHAGTSAGELIRWRALFVDQLLEVLWQRRQWQGASLALVAVGGYGRGELHPHSDIDLLVLYAEGDLESAGELESFLTSLWDIGLHIGHSVRTVDQCVEQAGADITILTSLIESRLLQGDESLLLAVSERIADPNLWPGRAFFEAKIEEQAQRHQKFADTEYNLEPNVKSSPGGLRDLQLIGWLARRYFGLSTAHQLSQAHFLTEQESVTVLSGQEFMWRVRYALHMITDRNEDRLLFDHQRELARMWGFEDGDKLAVEQFMHLYYRWAIALAQLNEVLLQNFDQAILGEGDAPEVEVIDDDFEISNRYIAARRPSLFLERPGALLDIFLLAGNTPGVQGISAPTIRLIRDHRHLIDDRFRRDPENRARFIRLFRESQQLTRQLRLMARYGVLGEYLPEFGRIVGQMQHDMFHAYTVDAHTLLVIEHTRRLLKSDFVDRFPVTSRVARRLPKKELLHIAALYHDIGKGRGGDHSELGAADAERFCVDHGLKKRETNLVVWLVRNHLVMSSVAQRKDISDPEVIQAFARHVGDEDRLDYLLALTVADINGTNPSLWNAWRASLLRQLYTETKRALRRGLENPIDRQVWIDDTKEAAMRLLEFRGFMPEELETLWAERGDDYFLREHPEDVAWHTEAIANHQKPDEPLVLVRNRFDSQIGNATQIFIFMRSDPLAFSRICANLDQLDLSIQDARIYTAADGMTLDTFYVLDSSGRSIEDDSNRIRHIRDYLRKHLAASASDAQLTVQRRTPRRVRSLSSPTETSLTVDPQQQVSVLEIASPDRPGLLARIGEVFTQHGVLLQAAKIQTLGERVEDVFFITNAEHQPITDPGLAESIQQAICDALDQPNAA